VPAGLCGRCQPGNDEKKSRSKREDEQELQSAAGRGMKRWGAVDEGDDPQADRQDENGRSRRADWMTNLTVCQFVDSESGAFPNPEAGAEKRAPFASSSQTLVPRAHTPW
jgi:hypothetical protein